MTENEKMMKKQLLLLAMMLLPMVANADAVEIDGIYYNLITKGKIAEVTSNPNKYSGSVAIPEKVKHEETEYSVTRIGDEAFLSCSDLTSVTIPNSVTSIGRAAFWWCRGLTSITFPESLTSIGSDAFAGCDGLTSMTFPNSLTSIGGSAFYGCDGLTSITIPESIRSIGKYAFESCEGLTSVTFPNSMTSIGEGIFQNCISLISFTIPESVTGIGSSAFYGCKGLTSITIPGSVTSIGDFAFDSCSGLTSITIPESVTSIGSRVFVSCDALSSMKVEAGNPKYDSRDNCNAIIETASNTLIAGCKNTTIPNSVTSIGDFAFYVCNGLTSITIPGCVTSIGEWAFAICRGLTSITIPNSVTSIGNYAFYGCSGLLDMFCYADNVPKAESKTFDSSNIANATLHVPDASIELYKTTAPWKDFKEIVGLSGTTLKCATPTITAKEGKLLYSCETEGVTFKWSYSFDSENAENEGNETILSGTKTCRVRVYATKEGYEDSDVATANVEVAWGKKGDANSDGEVDIADAVHIVNYVVGKINNLAPRKNNNQTDSE